MKTYFTPGRINLIGEHLDYNGGLVLPAALSIGITGKLTPRNDNIISLQSTSHSFTIEVDLNDPIYFDPKNEWTNYPLGVIEKLRKEEHQLSACDIVFESNLTEGSGLSSSAAIEVLTGYMLLAQTESHINLKWLSNFCREVENEFIGVKCGIMDQFSVAMGKADNAILLNCATLDYVYIPIELGDYRLLIMDSKKPRSLITSKYNEHKSQCEAALKILQVISPIEHLAEAKMEQLHLLKDEVLQRRVRHVITENLRVQQSIRALKVNDLSTFGRLLNVSHTSMQNDYEITGMEMDTLVEAAQQVKGCLGARMTGGGFGGCAIALVYKDSTEEFKNTVSAKYSAATALNCEIYESLIGDGVHEIKS